MIEADENKHKEARSALNEMIDATANAAYKFAGSCELGSERIKAFDVYEKIMDCRRN